MIINGCIVKNPDNIDEGIIASILKDLGYNQGIDNEALGVIGGTYVMQVHGDSDEFILKTEHAEYRCIHEGAIEDIFRREADEVYDLEQWKVEVRSNSTTLGYEDWFEQIVDEADYGSFFSSDGNLEEVEDYYIFRVD